MPRVLPSLLACLLLPVLLFAQTFSSFRIPPHRVYRLQGDAAGEYRAHRSHNQVSPYASSYRTSETQGGARLRGDWLWDSDPLRLYFDGELGAAATSAMNRSEGLSGSRSRYSGQTLREEWDVEAAARYYPLPFPVGFEAALRSDGNYRQLWSNEYNRSGAGPAGSLSYRDREEFRQIYRVLGTVAVGVGRVRDATAVYDIYALERRLEEVGALSRPLSDSGRQRLINLFYLRGEFSRVHERSGRHFWEDVETILREDGGLAGDEFDAYAIYRIAEPYIGAYSYYTEDYVGPDYPGYLPGSPRYLPGGSPLSSYFYTAGLLHRRYGYFIGLAAEVEDYHSLTRAWDHERRDYANPDTIAYPDQHEEQSFRENYWSNDYSWGPQVEGYLPIGWRWQLEGRAQFLFPEDNIDDALRIESEAGVMWAVADRWLVRMTTNYDRQILGRRTSLGPVSEFDSWSVNTQAAVYYYLQDRFSITLIADQDQRRYRQTFPSYISREDRFERDYQVELGLTYHFLGRLIAPGLASTSILD